MRNSALGLELCEFLRAASGIIQSNIGKAAGADALPLVECVSVVASQAGTIRVLSLAESVRD